MNAQPIAKHKGVFYRRGKWVAQIKRQRVCHHVGSFETQSEAIQARAARAEILGGHGRDPHPYSDEENAEILRVYATGGPTAAAAAIGRLPNAVRRQAQRLKVRTRDGGRPANSQESALMRALVPLIGSAVTLIMPGRNKSFVRRRHGDLTPKALANGGKVSRIAAEIFLRAHQPDARRVRLDLGISLNHYRPTTQRHGAAALLVLPDTVGIYEAGCTKAQIATDIVRCIAKRVGV